jgi:hypothetical protein
VSFPQSACGNSLLLDFSSIICLQPPSYTQISSQKTGKTLFFLTGFSLQRRCNRSFKVSSPGMAILYVPGCLLAIFHKQALRLLMEEIPEILNKGTD